MNWTNSQDRYGRLSIALHWLMFLLLVAGYTCIELREYYPKGSDTREALKTWHFMLGLTVFTLVWFRLLARMLQVMPAITPPLSPIVHLLGRLVHLLLYLFMIAMPVLGWLTLSAEGDAIPFWGLTLPPLVAPDEQLAEQVEEIHELIGTAGYFLIGLHAAAALVHHYFFRDNTLVRMLPGKSLSRR